MAIFGAVIIRTPSADKLDKTVSALHPSGKVYFLAKNLKNKTYLLEIYLPITLELKIWKDKCLLINFKLHVKYIFSFFTKIIQKTRPSTLFGLILMIIQISLFDC